MAAAIDEQFASEADPTTTRPEKAFVAHAGADIVELVTFTRWLGWGSVAAVLALIANAMALGVQDRVREHAVLQTLGFRPGLIVRMIVGEGVLIGLLGGALGTGVALAVVHVGRFSLSQEGLSINVSASWAVLGWGLLVSSGVGLLAGLTPELEVRTFADQSLFVRAAISGVLKEAVIAAAVAQILAGLLN